MRPRNDRESVGKSAVDPRGELPRKAFTREDGRPAMHFDGLLDFPSENSPMTPHTAGTIFALPSTHVGSHPKGTRSHSQATRSAPFAEFRNPAARSPRVASRTTNAQRWVVFSHRREPSPQVGPGGKSSGVMISPRALDQRTRPKMRPRAGTPRQAVARRFNPLYTSSCPAGQRERGVRVQ